jgi:riboflavin kinase/FMN adenylyltransferase
MQVEAELAKFKAKKDTLLTIGVFDGVHLGHRHLMSKLTGLARKQNLTSGVITFSQNPKEVLATQTGLPFLTDIERRTELIKDEGVDEVIPLTFTAELANLTPKEFLELLKKHLRMKGLVVGPDFALGKNREGDTDVLRNLSKEMGFSLTVVPPLTIDGEVVSSTAIRQALAEGDMKRAQRLMGRPFRLHGRVARGDKRGAELGFPTANLETGAEQALPADGVYTSRAFIENQAYPAMTNIGFQPTFGGNQRLVEVYLLDYRGDLYERELTIEIIERLRGEKKFDSPEELKKQIAEDVKRGKATLEIRGGS